MKTGQYTSHDRGRTTGSFRSGRDRGTDHLVEVPTRVERVHVEPVADLAGEAGHAHVHARDRDRDVGMIARAGGEEVGEQRERVEVALEAQRLLPLERARKIARSARTYSRSFGAGMLERHREAALDVGLHLAPQTEGEPTLLARASSHAVCAVIIGLRGNATAMAVPSSICDVTVRRHRARQERWPLRLGEPQPRESQLLDRVAPPARRPRAAGWRRTRRTVMSVRLQAEVAGDGVALDLAGAAGDGGDDRLAVAEAHHALGREAVPGEDLHPPPRRLARRSPNP